MERVVDSLVSKLLDGSAHIKSKYCMLDKMYENTMFGRTAIIVMDTRTIILAHLLYKTMENMNFILTEIMAFGSNHHMKENVTVMLGQ